MNPGGPLARFHAWRARLGAMAGHEHGWEVELVCPRCGHADRPVFEGWTPTRALRFGDSATIFADLRCSRCGEDLKGAAAVALAGLFADVGPPPGNRHPYLLGFALFGLPELVGVALLLVLPRGQWHLARYVMQAPLLYLGIAIPWFNGRVHAIRHRCPCGEPGYKFLGLLGRSGCYRCSTCGRLLRLRD